MKKAKAQRRAKLALDDPRWWPLTDVHAELTRRTGSRSLAADDLTDAMRRKPDPVRYMRRRLRPGTDSDRELGLPAFWDTYRIDSWSDALLIVPRVQAGPVVASLRGWVFYVWRPDFEQRWPSVEPSDAPTTMLRATPSEPRAADPLTPPAPRRRGGVLKHEWHAICAEIARRCINPKTGRVQVPKSENKLAEDMLTWLAESGKNCPATSEMRDAVKHICAALRTAQK
jgi:hypothetical protein